MRTKLLFSIAVLMLAAGTLMAQGEYDDIQIKTTQVSGNVYMLEGQGGNIGVLVGEDGIILIDDQFAPLTEKILSALKEIKDVPVKFVINTHWHGDHTGGNENLGKIATIIAHDNVRLRLSQKQFSKFLQREVEPSPQGAWPVITFTQGLSLHLNDEDVDVYHYPNGHTDGDSVIFFRKSNVVHVGDHMFSGRFPYVDLSSGGSVQGYIDNIQKLLNKIPDNVKLIPGHGPLSSKDDLQKLYDMMVETSDFIQVKIDQGKTLEEVQSGGLPEEFQKWSWRFIDEEKWITIVYQSLTQ